MSVALACVDGLDSAYRELQAVASGELSGLAGGITVGGLSEEEQRFARWHADLGESTKRFIAATSAHIKREGGTGLNNFIAEGECTQMCDYLVKHWDGNLDGALNVVRQREVNLIAEGKMHGLESVGTALGYRVKPPLARRPQDLLSGLYGAEFDRALRKDCLEGLHGAGVLAGEPEGALPELTDEEWADAGVLLGLAGIDGDGDYFEYEGELEELNGLLGGVGGLAGLDGWLSRKLRKLKKRIKRTARKIGRRIKRVVRKAKRAVKRTVRKVAKAVKKGVRKIGQSVKRAAKAVAKKSSGVFKALGKVFKKTVTFVRNGITYVWDKTKGLLKKVGKALVKAGRAIAQAMVWLARKVKAIAVKFAKHLNPKNIIARITMLRRIRKGKHGLANGLYYGMIGWEKARRLGASRKDYNDSKAAYEKTVRNLRDWGSGRKECDQAIRKGYRPNRTYRPESEAQLKRSVSGEIKASDRKAIVAREQQVVYSRQGVSEKDRKALSGGLGLAATAIIALVSLIVTFILAVIRMVIAIIQKRRQGKANRKREKELKADQKKKEQQVQQMMARHAEQEKAAIAALQAKNARPSSVPLPLPETKRAQQASMMMPLLIGGGLLGAAALIYHLMDGGPPGERENALEANAN